MKKRDLRAYMEDISEYGLDQLLVQHKCRLERGKLDASLQSRDEINVQLTEEEK